VLKRAGEHEQINAINKKDQLAAMNIPREFTHPLAIGRGSFSGVYRVYQPKLERHVVLKVIPLKDTRGADVIEKEARVLASMCLPCVPHIYDVIRFRKQVIIVMEWIHGIPLAVLMERSLAPDISSTLASSVIGAVALLHNNNIVHRDLKPENIMFTSDNRVFLVDFGFSFVNGAHDAPAGVIQGTPSYMAPELWSCRDEIDYKKADLYALGMVLRSLLGEKLPPFAAVLTSNDPVGRPQDCALFEKTWRALHPAGANNDTVSASLRPAVEEYTAHLLLKGARELNAGKKREEAYAILTESLEAWPDNPDALDFLQSKFSTPVRTTGNKRILLGIIAALVFVITCFAAYLLGMRSSSSAEFISTHSRIFDTEDNRLRLLTSSHPDRRSQPVTLVLRDSTGGADLTGTLIVTLPKSTGSLFIDKKPVAYPNGESATATLCAGTHRIEWIDSARMRTVGETVGLLPFETKTISLVRFADGT
jgi:serine/threonine protein kinase